VVDCDWRAHIEGMGVRGGINWYGIADQLIGVLVIEGMRFTSSSTALFVSV
jgi:hypothetical protein